MNLNDQELAINGVKIHRSSRKDFVQLISNKSYLAQTNK